MSDLATTIRDQWKRLGLVDIEIRESVGGQQAICKYGDRITGPWGVGCDPDPVVAIEKALIAGADLMNEKPARLASSREWTPVLKLPIVDDYEELL